MNLELKSDPDGEHIANRWLINGNILVETNRYSDEVVIWVLDDPPWSLSTADTVNLVFEEISNPYSNLVRRLTPLERDHILFSHDLHEAGCQNIYHIPEKRRR